MKTKLVWVLVGVIFVFGLNIWIEHSEQAKNLYTKWIEPIDDGTKVSLIWFILAGALIFIMWGHEKDKHSIRIQELKQRLESEMEILVQANMELSKYRLMDNFSNIITNFVRMQPYVIGVQYHQFIEQTRKGITKFRINFMDGVAADDANINAVHQLHYIVKSSVLRRFRKARDIFIEEEDPNFLVDFVIEVFELLESKEPESFTLHDAAICSLMFLALEMLERDYEIGIEILGDSEEKFRELVDSNRTGLLRGGITGHDFYSFRHTRENEKHNRQYVTRLVNVRDEKLLFMIALDSSIIEEEEYENILLSITDDFERLLILLEKGYNHSNERVGDINEQ